MSPPVKNIYYMLSYAFYSLNFKEYKKVASEEFDNIYELFSELLIIALNKQIKQGLYRDYIEVDETTSSIRGKINITESINELSFINKKLNCTYDEFSVNSYLNKIIKTTLTILLKAPISKEKRRPIKNILLYFRDVDTLDTNSINWQIRYDRNNQDYRMIIGICYLTLNGLLQSEKKGEKKLMEFRKKAMNPSNPTIRGTAQNEDIYFQATEVRNKYYDKIPDIVAKYMNEVNKITGKDYKPFNYYGSPNATKVIVAMGSVCDAVRETVDYLVNTS